VSEFPTIEDVVVREASRTGVNAYILRDLAAEDERLKHEREEVMDAYVRARNETVYKVASETLVSLTEIARFFAITPQYVGVIIRRERERDNAAGKISSLRLRDERGRPRLRIATVAGVDQQGVGDKPCDSGEA
jgi:hypothetical protein